MHFQALKNDESVSLCDASQGDDMSGGHFSANGRKQDTSLERGTLSWKMKSGRLVELEFSDCCSSGKPVSQQCSLVLQLVCLIPTLSGLPPDKSPLIKCHHHHLAVKMIKEELTFPPLH